MIPWLRRDRLPVLAALALAAGGREPLPEALEQLAAEDPLLRPWARRLCPRLRAGVALPDLLRRWRLVSRSEAGKCECNDQAGALTEIAAQAVTPPPGAFVIAWFPVLLVAAVVVPPWLMAHACALAGLDFGAFFKDLGISLPFLTKLCVEPAWIGLGWILLMLGSAIAIWSSIGWIPGLHWLRLLHAYDYHRCAAWLSMVRHGAGQAATGHTPPGWIRPARVWFGLTLFRITKRERPGFRYGTLLDRLAHGGCPGDLGWEVHVRLAEERLNTAVLAARPWLMNLLLATCCVSPFVFILLPLSSITEQMGGMDFPSSGGSTSGGSGPTSAFIAWALQWIGAAVKWLNAHLPDLSITMPSFSWPAYLEPPSWAFGVIVSVLAVVLILNIPALFALLFGWWLWPHLNRSARHLIAVHLHAAVARRQPLPAMFAALEPHLPWPWCWLVRRCAGATDDRMALATLADSRLLTAPERRALHCAMDAGPQALLLYAQSNSPSPARQMLDRISLVTVLKVVVVGWFFSFLFRGIIWKMSWICNETGLPSPGTLATWMNHHGWLFEAVVYGALFALLALLMFTRRHALAALGKQAMGRLIVSFTHAGMPEATMAAHLGAAGIPGDLAGAGARGDWPALVAAAGWPAKDVAHLVRLLSAAEARAERRARITVLALRIGTPLVLAIPVGAAAWYVFHLLTYIMDSL